MNIELLITIAAAIVLANLINKTVVNPITDRLFGNSSKAETGSRAEFAGSASSKKS